MTERESIMLFCPRDESLLWRHYLVDGRVEWRCAACGHAEPGRAVDYVVTRDDGVQTLQQYAALIRNAPHDPAGLFVPHSCECGLDFAALVVLGNDMLPFVRCLCGREGTGTRLEDVVQSK